MTLLRDEDLVARVQAAPPLVGGLRPPANWYSAESPVQSASVDLTIGGIFLPDTAPDAPGGVNDPRTEWTLKTGETAVVTTLEELRLPPNIAGVGFPPSRVSFRGLLMTNPGHIDPGYIGGLRFTVINMAREPYALKRGEVIVTVLLFELDRDVRADYVARRPGYAPRGPTREQIDWLSRDFVDVEKRSRSIAKSALLSAGVLAAMIALIPPVWQNFINPAWKALETKVAVLERSVQFEKQTNTIQAHQVQLDALTKELAQIKAATCSLRPTPAYCPPTARP